MDHYDYLIVGAGFAGAVLAERLASQTGKRCLVIDRRKHIAGNAYDAVDNAGVRLHLYGPHYFRTNSDQVVEYLSQFTDWHNVEYKIQSWTHGRYWQFPINLNTFEQIMGRPGTSQEMEETLEKWRVPIENPRNSEEVIISKVGWDLYRMFFENYTRKQWQRSPKELDPSVCARIPIRFNRDDRFLSEKFQALPDKGYTRMFEKMLQHPKIRVLTAVDFIQVRNQVRYEHLIYTGMIDEFYEFAHGRLPYRSLRFEPETIEREFFQHVVQVNYPNDYDYTRIVEIKHVTGQKLPRTTIVREYSQDYTGTNEAYYPVPAPDAARIYKAYAERAALDPKVSFVGRLATYRYFNMDQIVAMALSAFDTLREKHRNG